MKTCIEINTTKLNGQASIIDDANAYANKLAYSDRLQVILLKLNEKGN